MLTSGDAWRLVQEHAPRGAWLTVDELYRLVAERTTFDDSDLVNVAVKSFSPRWKRTVRNMLQGRKSTGMIEWDGKGRFRLPRA